MTVKVDNSGRIAWALLPGSISAELDVLAMLALAL